MGLRPLPCAPNTALRPLPVPRADDALWAPGSLEIPCWHLAARTQKTYRFPSQLPTQPRSQAQGGWKSQRSAQPSWHRPEESALHAWKMKAVVAK